jgi:hypothetical protein
MNIKRGVLSLVSVVIFSVAQTTFADKFCDTAREAGEESKNTYFIFIDPGAGSSLDVRDTLAKGMLKLFRSLGDFDHVVVKRADSSFSSGSTVFDRCVPACPDPSIWDKFGIGTCDTMQVRKGRNQFRKGLAKSALSLLSENQSVRSSDLVSTLTTAANVSRANSDILLFSDLQHAGPILTPITSDDYDELFFDVVNGGGYPDLSGRNLSVFGYGIQPDAKQEDIRNRRLFWDQIFILMKFNQIRIGQSYQ